MKNEENNLVLIPRTAELHSSCSVQGDVIIGDYTTIKENSIINTKQNTIIIGDSVRIHNNVNISSYGEEGHTYICNKVTIEHGAHICNSTLEDDVTIRAKAIIMDGCFVAEGAVIGEHSIITPNSRVTSHQICEPFSVYSGNPAVKIASLDVSIQNIKRAFKSPMFSQLV